MPKIVLHCSTCSKQLSNVAVKQNSNRICHHTLSVEIYFQRSISWKFLFSMPLVSDLKKKLRPSCLKRMKNFTMKFRDNIIKVEWGGSGNLHFLATKDSDVLATEVKIHFDFDVFQIRLLLRISFSLSIYYIFFRLSCPDTSSLWWPFCIISNAKFFHC